MLRLCIPGPDLANAAVVQGTRYRRIEDVLRERLGHEMARRCLEHEGRVSL